MRIDVYRRVAATGVSFWLLKILTTTAGDLSGDAMSIALHLGDWLSLAMVLIVSMVLLAAQLGSRRWHPWLYWALMLGSSAVGAELSDGLSRALHWGSATTSAVLLLGLGALLAAWSLGEGLPRMSGIARRKDEVLYWGAATLANSLGSALGDLLGGRLGLGLLGASAVFAGLLVVLWGVHRTTGAAARLLFWAAFTVSRIPF